MDRPVGVDGGSISQELLEKIKPYFFWEPFKNKKIINIFELCSQKSLQNRIVIKSSLTFCYGDRTCKIMAGDLIDELIFEFRGAFTEQCRSLQGLDYQDVVRNILVL